MSPFTSILSAFWWRLGQDCRLPLLPVFRAFRVGACIRRSQPEFVSRWTSSSVSVGLSCDLYALCAQCQFPVCVVLGDDEMWSSLIVRRRPCCIAKDIVPYSRTLATITTVGYGDNTPITIGTTCCLTCSFCMLRASRHSSCAEKTCSRKTFAHSGFKVPPLIEAVS